MNKDIFTYLKVYTNEHDTSIYVSITFSLDDEDELEFISQYDFIDVNKAFDNYKYDYIIQLSVENIGIVKSILNEIERMSVDREYIVGSTDRIGYFAQLVNCLCTFAY